MIKKKTKLRKIKYLQILYSLLSGIFLLPGSDAYAREMTPYPKIKLQTLDKATARTMTFDAEVGNTLKFHRIYMKVLSCQKSAPTDQPESAAFIQVWEIDQEQKPQWVYSGWMFASSPALSAMDHPLYDVWVVDCLADETAVPAATPAPADAETSAAAAQEGSVQKINPEDIPEETTE